ncbi:MAG: hypothetical protein M9916_08345 [Crocinitomicaceae bacterium]|nr:hypothetical protein [Crocinitomicaceae bacterium]
MYLEITNLLNENTIQLKSTHNKLCVPIIERICKKMKAGIKFSGIKVDENTIIDGHHRYVASLLAGVTIEKHPSYKTSGAVVYDWSSVQLTEEDWDTKAKILIKNQEDAEYNNITLEKLFELLK